MLIEFAGENPPSKSGESVRFVNLISIYAKNPSRRSCQMTNESMRFGRMIDAPGPEVWVRARERLQNGRRSVNRAVIGHEDFVAKSATFESAVSRKTSSLRTSAMPTRGWSSDVLLALNENPKPLPLSLNTDHRAKACQEPQHNLLGALPGDSLKRSAASLQVDSDIVKQVTLWLQHARVFGNHLIKVKGMVDAICIEKVEGIVR